MSRIIVIQLTMAGFCTETYAGGKLRIFQQRGRSGYVPTSANYSVSPNRNDLAASPMLGSFVPNQTMWVRGNGMMGGGYTPFNQDERDTMSLYGPFSANRAQMRPVQAFQTSAYGQVLPVQIGDAAAYPNYPWSDSLPGLSNSNHVFRPRSSAILPGWSTDSDTIDQN